jgi:hypothetical protein
MRAETTPSRVAVESVIASGSGCSARIVSSNQNLNCSKGSSLTEDSVNGSEMYSRRNEERMEEIWFMMACWQFAYWPVGIPCRLVNLLTH